MFRSFSLALCFMLTAVSVVAQGSEQGLLENAGLVMEEVEECRPQRVDRGAIRGTTIGRIEGSMPVHLVNPRHPCSCP